MRLSAVPLSKDTTMKHDQPMKPDMPAWLVACVLSLVCAGAVHFNMHELAVYFGLLALGMFMQSAAYVVKDKHNP